MSGPSFISGVKQYMLLPVLKTRVNLPFNLRKGFPKGTRGLKVVVVSNLSEETAFFHQGAPCLQVRSCLSPAFGKGLRLNLA